MNPARSLAPAIVSGYYIDWLYLTAPLYWNFNSSIIIKN